MDQSPIVGTISVTHQTQHGIVAEINGQTKLFPGLDALFRTAIDLLERNPTQAHPATTEKERNPT